jgi:hypothetical protein
MHTLLALVALSSAVSTANLSVSPTWLDDYSAAQRQVTAVGKPMVVFVGSGPEGWSKVVRDGAIDRAVNKLLAEKFVCLYVDTSTTTGRTLAEAFVVGRRGLVISDKAGTSQAFSLAGDLTRAELAQTLAKYAEANGQVRTTETVVREAPVTTRPAPATYQSTPVYTQSYYVPQYAPQYRYGPAYPTGGS